MSDQNNEFPWLVKIIFKEKKHFSNTDYSTIEQPTSEDSSPKAVLASVL